MKQDNQNIFQQYAGKKVEIMIRPDIPAISGEVVECNENFIAVGDTLLSYQMIWGIKIVDDDVVVKPEEKQNISQEPAQKSEVKEQEIKSEQPEPIKQTEQPKQPEEIEETKQAEQTEQVEQKIEVKDEWKDKIFEGELVQFHPRRKYGAIYCPALRENGIPIRDNDKIFVHANQITDETLREKLLKKDMKANNHKPMVKVSFRVSSNSGGLCADDVKAVEKIELETPAPAPAPEVKTQEAEIKEESKIPEIKEEYELKPVSDEIEIPEKTEETQELTFEQLLEQNLDWKKQVFEGNLVTYKPEKRFGFIESAELSRYIHEGDDDDFSKVKRIFFHVNQITDQDLRKRILTDNNPTPMIKVMFTLGNNDKGVAAFNIKAKFQIPTDLLKVQVSSSLYEEGEIEYYKRYDAEPNGKIRSKDNKLYKFYESDIADPLLAVFVECSPSAEGQKVQFMKVMKGNQTEIRNIKSASAFPKERVSDWERSGLIEKAKQRLNLV
ncbi:MAG: hypothetical protein II960_03630 [Synergistaceae bacterium]|nr:hypothetical protein [Synergistaceae bacterium]